MKRYSMLVLLVLFGLTTQVGLAQEDDPSAKQEGKYETEAFRNILNENKDYIVTVKAVISVSAQGGSREMKQEFSGLLVDSSGVVLLPGAPFQTTETTYRGRPVTLKREAKSLKVVFGTDPKEHEAFLGAKDDRFGLAFVQIKESKELPELKSLSLSEHASPELGEQVVWATRLGKKFDYEPIFNLARINATLSTPRNMWSMTRNPLPGHPVFNMNGKLIGVVGSVKTDDESSGFGGLLGIGSGNSFLLPADDIKKILDRAKMQIEETKKEMEKKEKEKKKEEDGEKKNNEETKEENTEENSGDKK